MDEGTVVEWTVDEGEAVEEDEVIAVVESEKASADVDSREDGVLRVVLGEEGDVVEPGDPIGIVAGRDESIEPYLDGVDVESRDEAAGERPGETAGDTDGDRGALGTSGSDTEESTGGADAVRATPGAKQRARETDVDLATVEGSGPGDVVTEADVEAASEGSDAASTASAAGVETGTGPPDPTVADRRSLSGIQQSIADRLSRSDRNAVHVTVNREIPTAGLQAVRLAADRTAEQSISLTDVLLAAVTETLRAHPDFNAHYVEGEHIRFEDVDLGVAVDADEGLVTPVVRRAQERSLEALAAERRRLTDRVQRGEFTEDDLSGSTFTVTNLGTFGVDHFDPVLNPPEVGILGVGRIRPDGQMTLSLSFDHRIVNGADAGRFLETLAGYLTHESELFAVTD